MRFKIIAFTLFVSFAGPAAAELLPATIAYLREIGIDPNSPQVKEVANDKVDKEDLNTLAADRARRDVLRFIATRNYLRDIKRDNSAKFPEHYDGDYLSREEQVFVGKIIAKRFGIDPKSK